METALCETVFYQIIIEDSDWKIQKYPLINWQNESELADFIEGGLASSWDIPDPGFNERRYSESELDNDIIGFDALSNF